MFSTMARIKRRIALPRSFGQRIPDYGVVDYLRKHTFDPIQRFVLTDQFGMGFSVQKVLASFHHKWGL